MDEQAAAQALAADREATLARIEAVTADLDDVAAAAVDRNGEDEQDPEATTIAFEREQLAALRVQAEDHIKEIDAALERLSAGRYGVCVRCGNPIGEERLAARPAVELCVSCAAKARR